jgi:hypothetical protein
MRPAEAADGDVAKSARGVEETFRDGLQRVEPGALLLGHAARSWWPPQGAVAGSARKKIRVAAPHQQHGSAGTFSLSAMGMRPGSCTA